MIRDQRGQLSDIAYEKITPSGRLTVDIRPTNSLYSVCGLITGPHIEVLMAGLVKVTKGRNNLTGSKVSQKMTYWGVISKGELMIFRHFGDREPRITVSIDNAMMASRIKGSVSEATGGGKGRTANLVRKTSLLGIKAPNGPEVVEEQLREFTIRCGEMHRNKLIFATPHTRECRHWVDVLEYYISRSKGEKRRIRQSYNEKGGAPNAPTMPTKAELGLA